MFKMQHAKTGHIVFASSRKDVAYWGAAGYRTVENAWI